MSEEKPADAEPKSKLSATDQKMVGEIDFGEHAKDLENGPIRNRWVTDVFCAIIFCVACIAFVVAVVYGFVGGQPRNMLIGWDADGNGCGYSPLTKDYPFIYWPQAPNT